MIEMKYSEATAKEKALEDKVSRLTASFEEAQRELHDFRTALGDAKIVLPESESTPDAVMPKVKVKATAKVTKASADKPVKAKATKKARTVTKESRLNAKVGRDAVAKGSRPTLKKAMVLVMGDEVMDANSVVAALREKGWMPASTDPRQYISYMLSSNTPKVFERTERRGFYCVRPGYLASQGNNKGTKSKKSNGSSTRKAQATKKAKAASESNPKVDEVLENIYGSDVASGNVESNPFEPSVMS